MRKHAGADCVRVSFDRGDGLVRVRIQDNGQGFDPERAGGAEGSHFGLRLMWERAEQVGGTLRVDSAPGQGTCVTVEVARRLSVPPMMPEMDGFEVLAVVKSDPAWCDLPVIVISPLDEMDGVARCIGMGAEGFLPKPFDPLLLRARLGACLEKKRLRDQEVE